MQMTTSLSFIIFAALAACMLHGAIVEAVAMPYCNPDVYESLPPRLRRICAALYGIGEITNAVEQSLDEKAQRDNIPFIDSGVKRQDVDHVFLRFGRR